jgi:hypothetical protein
VETGGFSSAMIFGTPEALLRSAKRIKIKREETRKILAVAFIGYAFRQVRKKIEKWKIEIGEIESAVAGGK